MKITKITLVTAFTLAILSVGAQNSISQSVIAKLESNKWVQITPNASHSYTVEFKAKTITVTFIANEDTLILANEFYLSNTPDSTFNPNLPDPNEPIKYIIARDSKKDTAHKVSEIIKLTDTELIIQPITNLNSLLNQQQLSYKAVK